MSFLFQSCQCSNVILKAVLYRCLHDSLPRNYSQSLQQFFVFSLFYPPSLKSKFFINYTSIHTVCIDFYPHQCCTYRIKGQNKNHRFALNKIKRTKRSLFRGTTLIDIHRYPLGAYNAGVRLNFHLRLGIGSIHSIRGIFQPVNSTLFRKKTYVLFPFNDFQFNFLYYAI